MRTIHRELRGRPTTNKRMAQEANAWADRLRKEREAKEKPPEQPKDKK